MSRIKIPLNELKIEAMEYLNNCLLVTSGINEEGKFNGMTVNWGFVGKIWFKPCVLLVIRPSRYTWEFIKGSNDFTVSSFPKDYQNTLNMLGTKSGRNTDKMKESGLIPIDSMDVRSPSFEQASLTLECRKWYVGDIEKEGILDPEVIKADYPKGDYHKIVIGEIVSAWKACK